MAVASHAESLLLIADTGVEVARVRYKKLREFDNTDVEVASDGSYSTTKTMCGKSIEMHSPHTLISFPVLTKNTC